MNPTTDSTPAIELRGVSKTFADATVVRDLDLTIRQGEFFSLLGPSGCGKTTTLRMMAGFEFPDDGEIRLEGKNVSRVPANRRAVNLVFQRYELFPHMSVRRNVEYGLIVSRVPKREITERVDAMLATVGVDMLADRRADQLSGGQQQRVALARALVNRPKALLLDEPLSALDVKLRKHMQIELKAIQEKLGTTFVYVTHDQEEALLMSDRIGIMSKGSLLQVGSPQEIYESPADPFVADFVGELNAFVVTVDSVASSGRRGDAIVRLDTSVAHGAERRVAVRPERITMVSKAKAGSTAVPGVVRERMYLGHLQQYTVETAFGAMLTQSSAGDTARVLEVGEATVLTWPDEALIDLGAA